MEEIFSNRAIGKCVCIDWDIFYDDFLKQAIPATISLINDLRKFTGEDITAYYQRSAKNNVHIALKFTRQLSVLDGFMIRGWMGDDRTRLRLDLARYAKTDSLHEMNRCFQDKITVQNGIATLSSAGPWIRLHLFLPDTLPSSSESHTLIDQMEEDRKKKKKDAQEQLKINPETTEDLGFI